MSTYTIPQMLMEVERELALRRSVYPRMLREKKMTPADQQLMMGTMEAIRDMLKDMQGQGQLFGTDTIEFEAMRTALDRLVKELSVPVTISGWDRLRAIVKGVRP